MLARLPPEMQVYILSGLDLRALLAARATSRALRRAADIASRHFRVVVSEHMPLDAQLLERISWFRGEVVLRVASDAQSALLQSTGLACRLLRVSAHGTAVTDVDVTALVALPSLTFVQLSHCPLLTDEAARALATCSSLTRANL